MATFSTVDCKEVPDTRNETYDVKNGAAAAVQLYCVFENKDLLIQDLLGNARAYPYSTATRPPVATNATAKPVGFRDATINGQGFDLLDYIVSVSYTTNQDKTTLVTESLEPAAEFIRLDHRQFRWASDNAPLTEGEAPGFLQHSFNLVRRYTGINSLPPAILTMGGKVNADPYTSTLLGLTFAAETLLFIPQPTDRTITTAGSDGFNLALAFGFKPNGWNKFWRPDTQTWDRFVTAEGDAADNYPPDDFSGFFA